MKLAKKELGVLTTLALVLLYLTFARSGFAKEQRQKVIDFEDEVVEGMNKRPLDSLNYVSEQDKEHARKRLYRKRIGFKTEIQETLRDLRYR